MVSQFFKKRCSNPDIKCLIIVTALSSVFSLACADRVSVNKVQAEELEQGTGEREEKKAETYVRTAEYWFSPGVSSAEEGNFKEAKGAFINAIDIKPDFAEAHYGLGSIYVMFNDIGSAFDEYKILINLDRQLAYKLFRQIYK